MIIVVLSEKGGVGKTMVAIQVAVELARRKLSVLVLDTDRGLTLSDWYEKSDDQRPAGLKVLKMGGTGLRYRLENFIKRYDVIIIDTPNHVGPLQQQAMAIADLAIVPCSPSGSDVDRLKRTLPLLEKGQRMNPRLKIGILVNLKKDRRFSGQNARRVLTDSGFFVFETELSDLAEYDYSYNTGKGVTTYASWSNAALEIRTLVTEIDNFLKETSSARSSLDETRPIARRLAKEKTAQASAR